MDEGRDEAVKFKRALATYLGFAGIFFVVPKMFGLADWSWFIVLAPLWIPVVAVAVTVMWISACWIFAGWVDE